MDELDGKPKNIRDIVSQVKSGHLNKPDAIHEIRSALQTGGNGRSETAQHSVRDSDTDYDNQQGQSEERQSLSTIGQSRFSQEDRRLLINKLIEKKKQSRAPADGNDGDDFDDHSQPFLHDRNQYIPDESVSSIDPTPSMTHEPIQAWVEPRSEDDTDARENSERNIHRQDRSTNSGYNHRASDDSMIGDARSYRIAQTEAAIRQEMFKECTFKPAVKALPHSYGAMKDSDTPFYARVTRWQKDKEADAIRRKQMVDKSEVVDCTFHPKINRNSEKAITEIRGEVNETANERLYKSSEVILTQKAKFIEDELRRERQEEDMECTFRPHVVTDKNKFADVSAKYDSTQRKSYTAEDVPEMKECTFTPKVAIFLVID